MTSYDTTTAALRKLIADAMEQTTDNVPRALAIFQQTKKTDAMRNELERFYFVNNLPKAHSSGHDPSETQISAAAAVGQPGSSQGAIDTHARNAASGRPSLAKPVHVKKHRRNRPQSKELRDFEAEHAINAVFTSRMVNGRPIGMIAWGELTTLTSEIAVSAASFLQRGADATETALLLHYLKQSYAQVQDHTQLIHEIVSPATFRECEKRAREMLPRLIEAGMQYHVGNVKNPEQIDHARS